MKDVICGCGAKTSISKTYFSYLEEGQRVEPKIVWLCEECFADCDLTCDDHGPCDYTNSPEILNLFGGEVKEDTVIAFCSHCVREMVNDLGEETITKLKEVFLNSENFEKTEEVLIIGETYLPDDLYKENPLVASLMFYKHVSLTPTEFDRLF